MCVFEVICAITHTSFESMQKKYFDYTQVQINPQVRDQPLLELIEIVHYFLILDVNIYFSLI